ncbi:MAG: EAL domain-containing protein [Nitrospirae bacterium]|nr:EAL domain-containing protein [Nitrospirota bacterium]
MTEKNSDNNGCAAIEDELVFRLAFEHLVSDISTGFIDLDASMMDQGVDEALKRIGEFTGVDRSYVFLFRGDGSTMDNTHEWCADGIGHEICNLKGVSIEAEVPWFMKTLLRDGVVHVPDISRLPREASADRLHFEQQGIQSLIVVVMRYRGEVKGFLGFDSVRDKLCWGADTIQLLRLAGEIIINAIERKRAENALRREEQRYKSLYDDNPSMFFTIDRNGIIISTNRFGAESLGYHADELIGQPIVILHREADREAAQAHIEKCFRRPSELHRRESCKVHREGALSWVRETSRIIENEDGADVLLQVCEDINEAHYLSEQLTYQASHDSLTGLFNRRAFVQRLQRALETARSEETEHALCYLDLDQFKVINDTCGHAAGDELLRRLGSVIGRNLRRRDTVARLGGDEFGLLMEYCSLEHSLKLAHTLRKAIEDFRFVWEDKGFSIGVSIGLVPITKNSENITLLMRAADTACFAAKDDGRNRVHVYKEDDSELARRYSEMEWVAKLNTAFEKNRFILCAQKIMPLVSGADDRAHYEILVRMMDDDNRAIAPGMFLPAAERYNITPRLDRWVITATFKWLAAHPEHLEALHLCSINLSGLSLGDPEFLAFVIRQFEDTGVPASKICFEITETAAIANVNEATGFIKTLKKFGCIFALDDFGSGLSSFAYLKHLPVDLLKIDGVFVKDIVDDQLDMAMVKSINEIGHVMGKRTIAEFVENAEILRVLREIGVDYVQGYHIGRPEPLDGEN